MLEIKEFFETTTLQSVTQPRDEESMILARLMFPEKCLWKSRFVLPEMAKMSLQEFYKTLAGFPFGDINVEPRMTKALVEPKVSTEPIAVRGGQLKIRSAQLEVGKFYKFHYLGEELILQKLPDGKIKFFEITEAEK